LTASKRPFTKQEVQDALSKMGYQVVYVRKKLFDKAGSVPLTEVVSFVRVSADLIRQKLPFNEMMQLLINDIQKEPTGVYPRYQPEIETGEGQRKKRSSSTKRNWVVCRSHARPCFKERNMGEILREHGEVS